MIWFGNCVLTQFVINESWRFKLEVFLLLLLFKFIVYLCKFCSPFPLTLSPNPTIITFTYKKKSFTYEYPTPTAKLSNTTKLPINTTVLTIFYWLNPTSNVPIIPKTNDIITKDIISIVVNIVNKKGFFIIRCFINLCEAHCVRVLI